MNSMEDKRRVEGFGLRRYFFTGVAVVLPLFVTGYIFFLLLIFSERIAGRHINHFLRSSYGFEIPGLGIILLFFAIVLIGFSFSILIKTKWFPFIEKLILRMPVFSGIYPSVKKLSAYLNEDDGKYRKVVLVEYPAPGEFQIGFITNQNLKKLSSQLGGEIICVFVPFPPSPFSGVMLLVKKEKIRLLDITIREATHFIVSAGIVAPERMA